VDTEGGAGELEVAVECALRIVTAAAQASGSLRRRLEVRGFAPELAVSAVARLAEMGLVDDEAFAAGVARRMAERCESDACIRARLGKRGVSRAGAAAAVGALEMGEDERAERFARARLGRRRGESADGYRLRVCCALRRRWFPWGVAEDVAAELASGSEGDACAIA
jgi:regulatory protein